MSLPFDWKRSVRLVAYIYKFSTGDIDEMTLDDLNFWIDGIPEIAKYMGVM